ncbi:TIGR03905 family TSCPD domain-containing protein [Clostridium sp. BJN0013]|uniref:TIGR03905 family TSCPD domain-containing protein n=1 Tax=Clostridium sp. BJN0013 TaxID=3236840 RepID=UPI0034C65F44
MYSYITKEVCSRQINFDISNNKIKNANFIGGCNGNLQGISRLVEGMDLNEAITKLQGISCNGKGTSCPDQLATALKEFIVIN